MMKIIIVCVIKKFNAGQKLTQVFTILKMSVFF